MQGLSSSRSRVLLAAVGVIIIIVAVAAYFVTSGPSSGDSSRVSSLSSAVSSLNAVVSSQSSQIDALQSGQGKTTTIVVTGNGTGSPSTVTQTLTSTTTKTSISTLTMVSYSVLPVGQPDTVSISGSLNIPGGNGSGTLTINVANTGGDPVVGVVVTVPVGPDRTSDLCSSACNMAVLYNGLPVATGNPIPVGNNAAGTLTTSQGLAGESYTIIVSITYADGTTPPPQNYVVSGIAQ